MPAAVRSGCWSSGGLGVALLACALAACTPKPVAPAHPEARDLEIALQDWISHMDPGHRFLVVIQPDLHGRPGSPAFDVIVSSEWMGLSDPDRLVLAGKVQGAWQGILADRHAGWLPLALTDANNRPLATFVGGKVVLAD